MMRGALAISSFLSVIVFPWPFTVLVTFLASLLEPLIPLSAGLFADMLYYSPQAGAVPFYTLCGALLTALVYFVRSRLNIGSIGE